MTRRVVVTGLGVVTPLGCEVDAVWARLLAGERSVSAPQRSGSEGAPSPAVGEVAPSDVDSLRAAYPPVAACGDMRTVFGYAAAARAIAHASLAPGTHDRAGVILGSGPGVHRIEDVDRRLADDGRLSDGASADAFAAYEPESLVRNATEMPAARVATAYGIGGPVHGVTTACSASNQALGMGFRSVRSGETDWVVAGGCDAQVNPLGLVFFVLLGASAHVDADSDPADACRPFDRRRSGLVMGEGAGCAILEAEEHARARGAPILAEVAGYGASLDAYRITAPPPDGRGAAEAMAQALRDGGVAPEDVDFVNAHGTATKRNDPAEIRAIQTVFGPHAPRLAVSSGKGAIGHLLSAAAGVAFALCVKAVQEDAVPPTANLTQPDPATAGIDLVPDANRRTQVRAALNNSFAFGGQNACLVVRKIESGDPT